MNCIKFFLRSYVRPDAENWRWAPHGKFLLLGHGYGRYMKTISEADLKCRLRVV